MLGLAFRVVVPEVVDFVDFAVGTDFFLATGCGLGNTPHGRIGSRPPQEGRGSAGGAAGLGVAVTLGGLVLFGGEVGEVDGNARCVLHCRRQVLINAIDP